MNESAKSSSEFKWTGSELYQGYMGRWSGKLADLFLDWLKPEPGRAWADVGCGTGALSARVLARVKPSKLYAVEPSEAFRAQAAQRLGEDGEVLAGDAETLPLKDASVDYLVAGLVLNFVPDPENAMAEAARVLKPGGTAGAYVWDYSGEMQMLQRFWAAAKAVAKGKLPEGQGEDFPLCNPVSLEQLFRGEGLDNITVSKLDLGMTFADFDDLWLPFTRGSFPAPAYAQSLSAQDQAALREALRASCPPETDGTIKLIGRAWAVKGSV